LPDLDDGIRRELERLARPGDPVGAMERVLRAKRRVRVMRRAQVAALALAVVAGSAGAVLALDRAFRPGAIFGDRPQVGPTVTSSPSPTGKPCPNVFSIGRPGGFPAGYRTLPPVGHGDVLGDGMTAVIRVGWNRNLPLGCSVLLMVRHPNLTSVTSVPMFRWLPDPPRFLMTAEIDGQPGVEIVLDLGGPGHPHRSGQVFTFEPKPGGRLHGSLVNMKREPSPGSPGILLPLGGEFAAGVDCVAEGTVVVTAGGLAAGGDTRHDISRTLYVAEQGTFVEVSSEHFNVPVGEEDERWPELADNPFRSCPSG
jgi:hypothetical protein